MKPDDSSLETEQLTTVRAAAVALLNEGDGWTLRSSRIDDLMAAAKLRVAPMNAFDEGVIQRYIRVAGRRIEEVLKKAISQVRGLLDVHADIVHVDTSVSAEKQNFVKLHEAGHNQLPHQKKLFRWLQDCDQHLADDTADLFEREANNFARIALFQDDGFAKVMTQYDFGLKGPLKEGRKFGASAYASLREYVRTNARACALVVLDPLIICPDRGAVADVRRIQISRSYQAQFGALVTPATLTRADKLISCIPFGKARMSGPRTLRLSDRNGTPYEFIGEGFKTPHNTFILIYAVRPVASQSGFIIGSRAG